MMEKSFSVLQEEKKNQDKRKTMKHNEINATQHKVGNIAALST